MPGEPSEDAVRLRAYFISERRRRFALPGDNESDWLEAKRQLLAEARRWNRALVPERIVNHGSHGWVQINQNLLPGISLSVSSV